MTLNERSRNEWLGNLNCSHSTLYDSQLNNILGLGAPSNRTPPS